MSMLHDVYPWESFEEYTERMGPNIVRTVALRNLYSRCRMGMTKYNSHPPTRLRKNERRKLRNWLQTLASYDVPHYESYNSESDGA